MTVTGMGVSTMALLVWVSHGTDSENKRTKRPYPSSGRGRETHATCRIPDRESIPSTFLQLGRLIG